MVISSLGGGGAERMCALIAGGLYRRGHAVTVVTLFGTDVDAYPLDDGVSRVALSLAGESGGTARAIGANLRRVRALRKEILRGSPDAVISFIDEMNVLTLLAVMNSSVPVVVSQRVDPAMHSPGRVWRALRRLSYWRASAMVSISRGIDRRFDWIPEERREVIYNIVVPEAATGDPGPSPYRASEASRHVIGVGRLVRQKGFDLLIRAFASVAGRHADWDLWVFGEGPERASLERLIEELGIEGRVFLPGWSERVFDAYRHADLFVLSSRYEGFGNVIIEAMSSGLPVLVTDCPSGPAEIVRGGDDGLLVPSEDVVALATGMERLMADPAERARLADRGVRAAARFGLDAALDRWERVLRRVASR
jgi:glycosyltransferase involved in cell wall biosynthesis